MSLRATIAVMGAGAEVKIADFDDATSDFDALLDLHRQHKDRLGFFTAEGFADAIRRGWLVGAWAGNELVGYTLFRFRKRDNSVSLTHVCVANGWQRHGIARLMVNAVAERYVSASALTLKCRVDYPAARLWPALHFRQVGTTKGRSINRETTLATWVRELGDTLFTYQGDDDRLLAAIDTDVLRDIIEPREGFPSSLALVDDWVADAVELLRVPNVDTEVNQAVESGALQAGSAERFRLVRPDSADVETLTRALVDAQISRAVKSGDRRNLSQAAAAGIPIFVTRDSAMLSSSNAVRRALNIEVLSPSDFLLRLHSESSTDDYRPSAVARTGLFIEPATAVPSNETLSRLVDHESDEGARELGEVLLQCASEAKLGSRIVTIVDQDERAVALFTERFSDRDQTLSVDTIRVGTDRDRYAIARQIVHLSRKHCVGKNGGRVEVNGRVPEYLVRALRDEGFEFGENGWFATCDCRVLHEQDLSPLASEGPTVGDLSQESASRLERERWPLKIFGTGLPTYIVPISPAWAQALIDHDPPQSSLLQRDRQLGLSRDHVYYKSKAAFIKAPARLLWYVSQGKNDPNSGIRAWSWLDRVVTDRPGSLYRRFGSQGVFTRRDIESSGGKAGQATALLFSRTELFDRHLTLKICRTLVPELSQSGFLVTTRELDEQTFIKVYEAGMLSP